MTKSQCPECGITRTQIEVKAKVCWTCDWDEEEQGLDPAPDFDPGNIDSDEGLDPPACGTIVILPSYIGTSLRRYPYYEVRCSCGWMAGAPTRRDAKDFRNLHAGTLTGSRG